MKFEVWKCPGCGFRLLTPDPRPVCDCGVDMVLLEDPEDRERFARDLRKEFFGALFGEGEV